MPSIRLNKKNKTIKVVNRKDTIRLTKDENNIKFSHTGKVGPIGIQGIQGETGAGVPEGGNVGQMLMKASDENYDYSWQDPILADKTYSQTFTVQSEVAVSHNLNKYPSVVIMDTANDLVDGSVRYNNNNQLTVSFSAPFSGKIVCN